MNAAAFYRAIYTTLWRLNQRHDRRTASPACNDAPAHCATCNLTLGPREACLHIGVDLRCDDAGTHFHTDANSRGAQYDRP